MERLYVDESRASQQDVVGQAATANDVELFIVLIGFTVSSRLMWPRVNEHVPSKPEIMMGCFTILARDTLVVSRMHRGMMLIEDQVPPLLALIQRP